MFCGYQYWYLIAHVCGSSISLGGMEQSKPPPRVFSGVVMELHTFCLCVYCKFMFTYIIISWHLSLQVVRFMGSEYATVIHFMLGTRIRPVWQVLLYITCWEFRGSAFTRNSGHCCMVLWYDTLIYILRPCVVKVGLWIIVHSLRAFVPLKFTSRKVVLNETVWSLHPGK